MVRCKYVNSVIKRVTYIRGVPLVVFMYPPFTRMPGESHRRQFGSWLCSSDVFVVVVM